MAPPVRNFPGQLFLSWTRASRLILGAVTPLPLFQAQHNASGEGNTDLEL